MPKKQKRPDLFCPEIEHFIQDTGGLQILVTKENALESAKEALDKKENNVKR